MVSSDSTWGAVKVPRRRGPPREVVRDHQAQAVSHRPLERDTRLYRLTINRNAWSTVRIAGVVHLNLALQALQDGVGGRDRRDGRLIPNRLTSEWDPH